MMQDVSSPHKFDGSNASSGGWTSTIKQFDIYTKVDENYRVRTSWGALLSIVGWAVISILIFSEIRTYMLAGPKEHMVVDTSLGQQLTININISFHALTCAEVHFDAMDVAGDNQLNIEHEMLKQRLKPSGELEGQPSVALVGQFTKESSEVAADYCGPCYGAETELTKCCNTCDELKRAYEAKGWNTNLIVRNSTQCLKDKNNPFANVLPGEGCRVSGSMTVNKVAGNFHMTLGDSIVRDGAHIHQFVPSEAPGFNVSHTIHSLSFGNRYPSMAANPLDNAVRMVRKDPGTGLFQYFIKIVPTTVAHGPPGVFSAKMVTNQYTVSEKFRPVASNDFSNRAAFQSAVIPGIFFIYELSPFLVEVTYNHVPLSHLVTRLLAIVGGVFSILGVVDIVSFRLSKMGGAKSV